jgi:NADPH-dependent glutamate synthase beta subunit-like oxidoreductase
MKRQKHPEEMPLYFPRSNATTESNKTGSWRYFRPSYAEKTAPCSAACPVGQDIPRIEMLTTQGLLTKAWETILEENPFPSICGRVCFHPCETACNRAELDAPIAVHSLERFLGDHAISKNKAPDPNKVAQNSKNIAIAGAGPAGLAAAYFLSRLGYGCDVFEAQSAPGGLLRWGIPAYRLPDDMLSKEIKRIEPQGVTIHCETPVTEEFLEKIRATYDALFIGCGYGRPIQLKILGEELAHDGLHFLRQIRQAEMIPIRGTVAVVGGGNTAIDVARSLLRLGAKPIIVYRRRRQDMPAFAPEIEMALTEGIQLKELVSPIRFEEMKSSSSQANTDYVVTLQKMKVAAKEIKSRARVIPDGEKTETLSVDHIFIAIGAGPEAHWNTPSTKDSQQLKLSHCNIIEQELPVIFGGDLTNAAKSVTDAIASGKQAAMALDVFFKKGWEAIEASLFSCQVGAGPALSMASYLAESHKSRSAHIVSFDEINIDYFQSATRVTPSMRSAVESARSFSEIESTLSQSAANSEAARCFNCGICNACDYCRIFCPEVAIVAEKAQRFINLDYCKGCGICVTECPRNAMALEEEKK